MNIINNVRPNINTCESRTGEEIIVPTFNCLLTSCGLYSRQDLNQLDGTPRIRYVIYPTIYHISQSQTHDWVHRIASWTSLIGTETMMFESEEFFFDKTAGNNTGR